MKQDQVAPVDMELLPIDDRRSYRWDLIFVILIFIGVIWALVDFCHDVIAKAPY